MRNRVLGLLCLIEWKYDTNVEIQTRNNWRIFLSFKLSWTSFELTSYYHSWRCSFLRIINRSLHIRYTFISAAVFELEVEKKSFSNLRGFRYDKTAIPLIIETHLKGSQVAFTYLRYRDSVRHSRRTAQFVPFVQPFVIDRQGWAGVSFATQRETASFFNIRFVLWSNFENDVRWIKNSSRISVIASLT
jgi:hypothetical protein